jgi:hypothetical protein
LNGACSYPRLRQVLTRLRIDKFPSSAAFDAINDALKDPAEKKDAIKQGNAIFAFNIKNAAGEVESWHIDLKNKGEVIKGLPEKPTGTPPFPPLEWERRTLTMVPQ